MESILSSRLRFADDASSTVPPWYAKCWPTSTSARHPRDPAPRRPRHAAFLIDQGDEGREAGHPNLIAMVTAVVLPHVADTPWPWPCAPTRRAPSSTWSAWCSPTSSSRRRIARTPTSPNWSPTPSSTPVETTARTEKSGLPFNGSQGRVAFPASSPCPDGRDCQEATMHSLRRTIAVAFAATPGAASIVLLQQVSPTDEAAAHDGPQRLVLLVLQLRQQQQLQWRYIC